ncbi:MAG: ProQ/FINO family protein [Burkholderiaceae bacterium]|nr:ProQ/FINO family protein [Burkholderiaceae bacterium]
MHKPPEAPSSPAIQTAPVETLNPAPAEPAEAVAVPDISPAACGARLAECFPALFAVAAPDTAQHPPAPPKPLKLRIQADIQQRAPGLFSKRALGLFFSRYTTSNGYLKALTGAAQRFDLDGQPAGEISDEHRRMAAEELARRREFHQARRNAQRETQRAAQREQQAATQRQRTADEQARRERANLLHSFETATLTKANFCALKNVTEVALDAALAQARKERAEWRARAPVAAGPDPRRG